MSILTVLCDISLSEHPGIERLKTFRSGLLSDRGSIGGSDDEDAGSDLEEPVVMTPQPCKRVASQPLTQFLPASKKSCTEQDKGVPEP